MAITGTDNNNKNSYISALILLKNEDILSFYKTFKYLNEIFQFNSKVIHIDYNKKKSLNIVVNYKKYRVVILIIKNYIIFFI